MSLSRVNKMISDRVTSLRIMIALGLLIATSLIVFVEGMRTDNEAHSAVLDLLHTAELLEQKISDAATRPSSFNSETTDLMGEAILQVGRICEELKSVSLINESATTALQRDNYCRNSGKRQAILDEYKQINSKIDAFNREASSLVEKIPGPELRARALNSFLSGTLYQLVPAEERLQWVPHGLHLDAKSNSPSATTFAKRMSDAVTAIDDRLKLGQQISSPTIGQSLLELRQAYIKNHRHSEKKTFGYRVGLLVFCVLLVGSLYYVLIRLRSTTRKLSLLNQNLERRVLDRTEELSTALSELRRQQQALTQKTKMSALGEMAGGIAHEINTPLAAISLNMELLHAQAEELNVPDFQKGLQSVVRIVDRISKVVMGLRRFSRDGSQEPRRPLPIGEVIEDTLILCRERFKIHGVDVKVSLEDPAALITCTPEQIGQVLLNLLNNGFDAVAKLPHKWVRIETSSSAGTLTVRISDSGPGIPIEVQAKLMQPFFTTKEIGKGTGLGLSISKGIIESHGGRMTYDPTASTTTFLIELPQVSTESLVA